MGIAAWWKESVSGLFQFAQQVLNSQGCLRLCLDPLCALPFINLATTPVKLSHYCLCFVDEEAEALESLALRGGVEIGVFTVDVWVSLLSRL